MWVLDGSERSASRIGLLNSRKDLPGTSRVGGWVGPTVGVVVSEK